MMKMKIINENKRMIINSGASEYVGVREGMCMALVLHTTTSDPREMYGEVGSWGRALKARKRVLIRSRGGRESPCEKMQRTVTKDVPRKPRASLGLGFRV
jgi:hypothetical protein